MISSMPLSLCAIALDLTTAYVFVSLLVLGQPAQAQQLAEPRDSVMLPQRGDECIRRPSRLAAVSSHPRCRS